MHPDLALLLRYAKAHPDEDTARLVLADWLEENGDFHECARARLIRLEVEPSRGASRTLHPDAKTLSRQHLRSWLGGFAAIPGVVSGVCRRGLLRLQVEPAVLGELDHLTQISDW